VSETPSIRLPTVFRRRLTIAFVVVAGVASGVLAVGSYLVVSDQRHATFVDRSVDQTQVLLALTRGEQSAARLDSLVALARDRNGFDTLVESDGVVSSRTGLSLEDVPGDVRNARNDKIESGIADIDGAPFLVVGGQVPGVGDNRAHLYLFFSQADIRSTLAELRNVLIIGWVVVTAAAALAGVLIARRTLAPIQQAADAARSITEGLLDTRLPETGADEFGAWARYFNDMTGALETKISELQDAHARERRFTADVAHDLRTPLGAIVNSSTLLGYTLNDLPPSAKRPAELLIKDVGRLRRLVDDLLELGRLDSERVELRCEVIDMRNFVEAVVRNSGHSAEVDLDVSEVRVVSDRVRLERVLSNLVENAVVHGGKDVAVRVEVEDAFMTIDVTDGGKGVPADQIPHLFDRFYKVSSSRTGEGSGLGLAIASQHTRLLGGTLEVANREQGGARFTFRAPVAEADEGPP
jgi:signal transduction histidine kinase